MKIKKVFRKVLMIMSLMVCYYSIYGSDITSLTYETDEAYNVTGEYIASGYGVPENRLFKIFFIEDTRENEDLGKSIHVYQNGIEILPKKVIERDIPRYEGQLLSKSFTKYYEYEPKNGIISVRGLDDSIVLYETNFR